MSLRQHASALSKVTAVIVGFEETHSILILAVLRRMNPNVKVILYDKKTFSREVSILTSKDKVLFLNHPYLKYREILAMLTETMGSEDGTTRATIVGAIEHTNCSEFLRALNTAIRLPGAKTQLVLMTHKLSEDEILGTTLTRIFFDSFEGWDDHSIQILDTRQQEFETLINRALDFESPLDPERPLYLSRHFAVSLEIDEKIEEWHAEHDAFSTSHTMAVDQAQNLNDGIWRFVQPNYSSPITMQLIRLQKNPALLVIDTPHNPNGRWIYFIAKHEVSAEAIGIARERSIPYQASLSQVWVAPEHETEMIAIYRELLTKGK